MSSPASILLVEDDPLIRTFLADNLTADGYELYVAGTLEDALCELDFARPDIAVVDLRLPDGSGLELIRRVRESDGISDRIDAAMPLLMLSAAGSELDRLRGFEFGVDDYVVKPFGYPELRARIAAILRRARGRVESGRLHVGALEIDPVSRAATLRGRRVALAAKEFALLRVLASAPTRVFTKQELLKDIWGYRSSGSTRTLDSHASRLRQKLRRDGDPFVVNVWGVGYCLLDAPSVPAK